MTTLKTTSFSSLERIFCRLTMLHLISLILELALGWGELSSLGVYDLVGFALMVAGYVVFLSKPLPK